MPDVRTSIEYLEEMIRARGPEMAAERAKQTIAAYEADVNEAQRKLNLVKLMAEGKYDPDAPKVEKVAAKV